MSYSYSYSGLPQPHSHCLAQPSHCNRNSEWVSFLLKIMNLSEITACQETKLHPVHTILFLNIQIGIQSPFCLKWPRMQDEPACKCGWCLLPQAGQGTELLPTQQTLPQGQDPVTKASISHNVRIGMLEQVSQGMAAVAHLASINNTWGEKTLEDT